MELGMILKKGLDANLADREPTSRKKQHNLQEKGRKALHDKA
jgi:hypothetical protein